MPKKFGISIPSIPKRGLCTPAVLNEIFEFITEEVGGDARGFLAPGMTFGPAKISGLFNTKWRTEVQWFGGCRFFMGTELAERLQAACGSALVWEKIYPDSTDILEALPFVLDRDRVFPELICSVCGSRNTNILDWAYVNDFIKNHINTIHLINTPHGIVCSNIVYCALNGVSGVVFERLQT